MNLVSVVMVVYVVWFYLVKVGGGVIVNFISILFKVV